MMTPNTGAPVAGCARPPTLGAAPGAHAPDQECLTPRLGAEEYGIQILRVQEIRGYEAPTRIADAPPFVKGVVNLRGVIVPIVDLRPKFGIEDVAYGGSTVTVVLNIANRVVGIVVDSVSDVVQLRGAQIKPTPELGRAVDTDYITGIATLEQDGKCRMLILLDIEKLAASPEMGLFSQTLQ